MARKPQASRSGRGRSPSGEDRLIGRYFKPIARHPGALGLIDDAAVLSPPPGRDLVLTADMIVAGVHFFAEDPADAVARKALRVNLSDLAAKGAKPAGCLLSIALPKGTRKDWLKAFARGLGADCRRFECPLLGGDTVTTPGPVTISIAAFGVLPKGRMTRRSGAKAGDHVVVTGTIGDGALGLRLRTSVANWRLADAQRKHLLSRYLLPQPRSALAKAVRKYASGSMDVSDGLIGDLTKLCRASDVGAKIDAASVPLSRAARAALKADGQLLTTILTGGDDYEIVATVPPRKLKAFHAAARAAKVPLTGIGRIVKQPGVRVLGENGKDLSFTSTSFSHF